MKIGLLEFHQLPEETPKHYVTGAKAKRLVEELRVCTRVSASKIRVIVQHSWSIIKSWLKTSAEERKRAEESEQLRAHTAKTLQTRTLFPDGAQQNFSRWPSVDQRTVKA